VIDVPTVTVLIPARNEQADIERCLAAVLAQDHRHDRMEIILVDGGSTDRTVEIADRVLQAGDVRWKIVENPVGTTPSNLNVGLELALGEVLCRVDARSIVPTDYVRLCAELLSCSPDIAVTGGAQVARAADGSVRSAGIARGLNNRFAMGGSRYRSGAGSGPSDTVYLGAFRTAEVRAAGGWDERMLTNQDYELNRRLRRTGRVWFDSRLQVGYIPRQTFTDLGRQYHRFGRWKVRYWRMRAELPERRQLVLLAIPFVGALGLRSIWRGRPAAAVAAMLGGLLVLDVKGVRAPATPAVRAAGLLAALVASTGWWLGVVREALAPS